MSKLDMKQNNNLMRRYDIDFLRIFGVLLLIPFHSLLIFVMDPNSVVYIKDIIDSKLCDKIAGSIHQFHMPLLFVLAGMSTFLSLSKRSYMEFIKERIGKLLLPAIFGIVVLIPPMTYITRIVNGEQITFIKHFTGLFIIKISDFTGRGGSFTPAHLWFILFLFVYSLVGLPIFAAFQNERFSKILLNLGSFFEKRCTLVLLGIPLALASYLGILGAQNPIYYLIVYFTGYLIATDTRYQIAINRDMWIYLTLAILFELRRLAGFDFLLDWSYSWIIYGMMEEVNRLILVLLLLGVGNKFLNYTNSVIKYLSESSFAIYVLHLPVNTLVGYFIVKMNINIGIKYFFIVLITFLLCFVIYEIVKRVGILAFFLCIKPSKSNLLSKAL